MVFNNCKQRTACFNSASNISWLKDVSLCGPDWSKGWGEEQMQHQWWFPRSLCTRCHSGESADSWRCPPRTSGTGRRGLVFQTCTLGCYKKDILRMSVKLQTIARSLVFIYTFESFVPCIRQSTSASLQDRWSQQRQQELQTDERNTEWCTQPLCGSDIHHMDMPVYFWSAGCVSCFVHWKEVLIIQHAGIFQPAVSHVPSSPSYTLVSCVLLLYVRYM